MSPDPNPSRSSRAPKSTLSTIFAIALAFGFACLSARPASAQTEGYMIVLKDGNLIPAREKPTVEGGKFVFISPSGTRQSILVSEVDEAKTREYNKAGIGTAQIVKDPSAREPQKIPAKKGSVTDLIKRTGKGEIRDDPNVTGKPGAQGTTAAKGDAKAGASAPDPKAPGAAPPTGPAPAAAAAAAPSGAAPGASGHGSDVFVRALDEAGIRGASVTVVPGGIRIRAVADSEEKIFAALRAIARGVKESANQGAIIEKAEVNLTTAANEDAGRFIMTAKDAEALVTGTISPGRYFVANVSL